MKKIIHNIRKQPEAVRRHILHVLTMAFAVMLFFIWVYSLGSNFTNLNTKAGISQDLKPFSALTANMVDGYNSISQPNTDPNSNTGTDTNSDSNTDLRTQENNL